MTTLASFLSALQILHDVLYTFFDAYLCSGWRSRFVCSIYIHASNAPLPDFTVMALNRHKETRVTEPGIPPCMTIVASFLSASFFFLLASKMCRTGRVRVFAWTCVCACGGQAWMRMPALARSAVSRSSRWWPIWIRSHIGKSKLPCRFQPSPSYDLGVVRVERVVVSCPLMVAHDAYSNILYLPES